MAHGLEKSDRLIQPKKLSNKTEQSAAEKAEGSNCLGCQGVRWSQTSGCGGEWGWLYPPGPMLEESIEDGQQLAHAGG